MGKVAWYENDAEAAFAQARHSGRLLFLYWGANWCPPCNRIKSTTFSRADFAELAESFVALHVDGDAAGAQQIAAQYKLRSYPTLIVFRPDGTEIARLPCELAGALFVRTLELALRSNYTVVQSLSAALSRERPLSDDEWRMLSFYSWDTDEHQVLKNLDFAAALASMTRACTLNDARQRGRPEAAIKVMEEELNSPCTEEMAAFDQFIDYASQSEWEAVVFDTAPTGHTMRLLELPMDWSQQIDIKVFASVDTSAADDVAKKRFAQVIEMMRDPAQSTFAFVMYPESTPVLEAWRAAQELATVGIKPGLVVANLVIPPEAATTPFVRARRTMQEKYLAEIRERFATPMLELPLLPREVKGLQMLDELGTLAYGALEWTRQAV